MVGLSTRTGWIAVDGAILHYLIEGTGVPTLVLGSATYYPRTFSSELRANMRLAFSDTRHFAASAHSAYATGVTLDTYLHDIERLREATGFDRVVLIGHSHHGNLAVEYAARYPWHVSHLVLVGSAPTRVRQTIAAGKAYWEQYASPERKAVFEQLRSALAATHVGGMDPREAYIAQHLADAPKYWFNARYDPSWLWRDMPVNLGLIASFRQFFAAPDYHLLRSARRVHAPILVVTGRHDYAMPPVLWDGLQGTLPNLSVRIFERSGHTPQLEEPEGFDRTLTTWLSSPHTDR